MHRLLYIKDMQLQLSLKSDSREAMDPLTQCLEGGDRCGSINGKLILARQVLLVVAGSSIGHGISPVFNGIAFPLKVHIYSLGLLLDKALLLEPQASAVAKSFF